MQTRADNNWIVISGGPGAGKTTLCHNLELRGYATAPEMARLFIDTELARGLTLEQVRADELAFQQYVFAMQCEQEEHIPRERLTFFDRGIPDNLSYMRYHKLPIDQARLSAAAACSYRHVFLLDLLPLVHDYARQESEAEQRELQRLLDEIYSALPFPLTRVPAMNPDARAEFVLAELGLLGSQPGDGAAP
jgi:predicted ATPase